MYYKRKQVLKGRVFKTTICIFCLEQQDTGCESYLGLPTNINHCCYLICTSDFTYFVIHEFLKYSGQTFTHILHLLNAQKSELVKRTRIMSTIGWATWDRTRECQSQSLMPYRLAMAQYIECFQG